MPKSSAKPSNIHWGSTENERRGRIIFLHPPKQSSGVLKKFLGIELQFYADRTRVFSRINYSFIRRNFFKTHELSSFLCQASFQKLFTTLSENAVSSLRMPRCGDHGRRATNDELTRIVAYRHQLPVHRHGRSEEKRAVLPADPPRNCCPKT